MAHAVSVEAHGIVEIVWTPPVGYYQPYDEYIKNNDEPAKHLITWGPNNQKMVKVSTDKNWKREVRYIQRAQKERNMNDVNDQMQAATLDNRMGDIVAGFSNSSG